MVNTFYGYKIGQTQTFDEKGVKVVVTKIKTPHIKVERIKDKKKDGYGAVVVKVKSSKNILRELKVEDSDKLKQGNELSVDKIFKEGDKVKVTGRTKGRGFAGVMKRWGFKGGSRTHGQSDRQRAPGSIGQGTDPGRVWKGKKMAGRMGGVTKTIKGLRVYKINQQENEIWLTGLIPGPKKQLVKITKYEF